ncbi:hypothetical protein CHS0354_022796 [Potamilus streckersoni]|uniref:Uncharacterized protein n=1 Tax=Potamilus streckersoni TaxID=2493646 RepID=A0AAE0S203_9BIVA|nr:hypothetical protein CHS0354_022796 [Potamilus streckersoni]
MFLILFLLISLVHGESFDITKRVRMGKIQAAEWIDVNAAVSKERIEQEQIFHKLLDNTSSEIAKVFSSVCKSCMVMGNMGCISTLCTLGKYNKTSTPSNVFIKAELPELPAEGAFATGTSLHADILCSLCKQSNAVACVLRFCVDPKRDNHVKNGVGNVQCMQGFCKWQRGFGYNAIPSLWNPEQIYLWIAETVLNFDESVHDWNKFYDKLYKELLDMAVTTLKNRLIQNP